MLLTRIAVLFHIVNKLRGVAYINWDADFNPHFVDKMCTSYYSTGSVDVQQNLALSSMFSRLVVLSFRILEILLIFTEMFL